MVKKDLILGKRFTFHGQGYTGVFKAKNLNVAQSKP